MTVAELGLRMDAAEFLEWDAFDRVHTSDDWYQSALLRLTVAQVAGNKRATLEDFLPRRERVKGDPFGKLLAWARGHNTRLAKVQGDKT